MRHSVPQILVPVAVAVLSSAGFTLMALSPSDVAPTHQATSSNPVQANAPPLLSWISIEEQVELAALPSESRNALAEAHLCPPSQARDRSAVAGR